MNHDIKSHAIERPPVVVVMGHVDHGKSTLLDFIRKSNIVSKEAGGITQHVAAYEVTREHEGEQKRITFIDTPGHAAFQTIRARGATIADIAILVVAADDGVKAQTLEALQSIRDAHVPFIVAINKIDKPNANIERTQGSLAEHGVYLEKLGGDVPWTAISAKTGGGVDELLDLILIVAEFRELRAHPASLARGYVIEAHRDHKRGMAATLIITDGTLELGMSVVAGRGISPVRIMQDASGKTLKTATFSMPITLIGFDILPEVGATFIAYANKRDAEAARPSGSPPPTHTPTHTPESVDHFALPIIVRADTTGSLEAIAHEVVTLGNERSSVRIVQSGIGDISENDTKAALAGSLHASVFGFNVEADQTVREYARRQGVRIETFDIIYKLTERLQELMVDMRPERRVEEVVGKARVLKLFSTRKDMHVVGCVVHEGYMTRNATTKIMRRGVLIGIGTVRNIQSHKQDVSRVDTDSECGVELTSSFEITQGDVLECYVTSVS